MWTNRKKKVNTKLTSYFRKINSVSSQRRSLKYVPHA